MIVVGKMATFANDYLFWWNFKIAQLFCCHTDLPSN